MLKGLGMVCVLVGAVAFGVQCVRKRQLEQAQLRQFFNACYGMERELRCRSPDLAELLEQASRQTGGTVRQFFQACQAALCRLDAHAFDEIWTEQLTQTPFQLNTNAREAIRTVGTVLGRYDTDTQCRALRYAGETLEAMWKTGETTLRKRNQLSMTLSVAGGLLVLVLAC